MGHPAQIPLTPQTDERNFPVWEKGAPPGKSGHPYPKMLTKVCTKEDREEWLRRNVKIDRNTREEYWDDRAPRVGTPIPLLATDEVVNADLAKMPGEAIVVNSAADEATVLDMLGIGKAAQVAGKVSIPLAARSDDDDADFGSEADAVEEENRRLEAALKRNAELKKRLAATTADKAPTKKKVKRKKRRAAKTRAVSLEQMAESGDD